jgi:predicted permease
MRHQIRLAWRVLARRPLLSIIIALTIGGALAAATIAFAVVQGVLLEPLPYAAPDRLVTVWERGPENDRNVVSPANFLAWREQLRSFDQMASIMEVSATLGGEGEPERVGAVQATATYFPLVGAVPLVGRFYGEAEDVEGGPPVVVLGEGLWRRRFASDPALVGKTVLINGSAREVVGVLPSRFDFAPKAAFGRIGSRDIWLPPQFDGRARTWGGRFLQVLARVTPKTTVQAAQQEATTFATRLAELFPERNKGWGINVVPLRREVVGEVQTTLLVVFGSVCFVMLIACANVANLLLGRAAERRQEMAVRAALGAARQALLRQLLTESLVLAIAGGLIGLALASWGIGALVAAAPDLPRIESVRLDLGVVGFVVLMTGIVAVLTGLAPAVELSSQGSATWLTQRGSSGRREGRRLRRILVGAQVALSFVLLVGAGLLIRSLVNRLTISLGTNVDGVMIGDVSLTSSAYQSGARRMVLYQQLTDRIGAIPGVRAASLASIVPMSGSQQSHGFAALDRPASDANQFSVDVRFVHHRYHEVMGIRLVQGELLDGRDGPGAPRRVLINETGARLAWPNESPIGKMIAMEWGDSLVAEVAGVVGDVRLNGPDQAVDRATVYWDYRQLGERVPFGMTVVARTDRGEGIVPEMRAALREVDPALPLYNVRTMASLLKGVVARARFTTVALALFAGLALGLAILGVYGVMAHSTQQREREIGIRLALGADRLSVIRMILREGGAVIYPALGIGLVASLVLTRLLRTLVFGVRPEDPVTLGVALVVLGVAGLAACWLPARRASIVNPVEAIRAE